MVVKNFPPGLAQRQREYDIVLLLICVRTKNPGEGSVPESRAPVFSPMKHRDIAGHWYPVRAIRAHSKIIYIIKDV